ncbi:MAG TPA: hypothetical protein VH835_08710 [Dongiaceae bacterium]|jgi:hypothetical protein
MDVLQVHDIIELIEEIAIQGGGPGSRFRVSACKGITLPLPAGKPAARE